ncbi:hypothetical protein D0962_02670 [Leptolyngbyaceae cyanobacterium CCMR0082]|uniref:Peptidase A2 domain-containing protein n=1 Tax=Adonisia turfae CCMR0082 TaxID=2304604 RepID=A0A6M0S0D6_9CYAN|nr:retropepsin-like aspartic protease [Adonisia turfae]NEZ61690.1 hypothetical protein [Adonisia turfae CCMR0082]
MCDKREDIVVCPSIKDEVFRELNLCVIPISIQVGDALKFYDFLVDTGASQTAVTTSVIEELGIVEGTNVLVSDATTTSRGWRMAQIDRLSIGEMFFPRLNIIYINKFSSPFSKYKIDGCLGADVLKETHLKIDYLMPLLEMAKKIVS